jgi:hypothetical protein
MAQLLAAASDTAASLAQGATATKRAAPPGASPPPPAKRAKAGAKPGDAGAPDASAHSPVSKPAPAMPAATRRAAEAAADLVLDLLASRLQTTQRPDATPPVATTATTQQLALTSLPTPAQSHSDSRPIRPLWYRPTDRPLNADALHQGLPIPAPGNIALERLIWHDANHIEGLIFQLRQLARRESNEAAAAHQAALVVANSAGPTPLTDASHAQALTRCETTLNRWHRIHVLYHEGADLLDAAAAHLQAPITLFRGQVPSTTLLADPTLDPPS